MSEIGPGLFGAGLLSEQPKQVTERDLLLLAHVGLEALIEFATAHPEYEYCPEIQVAMQNLNALGREIATAGAILDQHIAAEAGVLINH
jgi:hypothetical protein